jgi:hypothetical protein
VGSLLSSPEGLAAVSKLMATPWGTHHPALVRPHDLAVISALTLHHIAHDSYIRSVLTPPHQHRLKGVFANHGKRT